MKNLPNPYDLMGGLDKKAMAVVLRLLTLAGQVGRLANGYFYEQASREVLAKYREVRVVTNSGRLVRAFDNTWELTKALPLPETEPCRVESDSTQESYEQVLNVHQALQENLHCRGADAAEEYALIASCMGGEKFRLGEAGIRELIEPLLPKKQKS